MGCGAPKTNTTTIDLPHVDINQHDQQQNVVKTQPSKTKITQETVEANSPKIFQNATLNEQDDPKQGDKDEVNDKNQNLHENKIQESQDNQQQDNQPPIFIPKPIAEKIAPIDPEIDIDVKVGTTLSTSQMKPIEKPSQQQPSIQPKRRVAKPILKSKEIDTIQLKLTVIDQVEQELDKDLKNKALKRCGSDLGGKEKIEFID